MEHEIINETAPFYMETTKWFSEFEAHPTQWPCCGEMVVESETMLDHWVHCPPCSSLRESTTFPVLVRKLYDNLIYSVREHQNTHPEETIHSYGVRFIAFPHEDTLLSPSPFLQREFEIQFAGYQLSYSLLTRPVDMSGWVAEHESSSTKGIWWYLGWFPGDLPVFQPEYSLPSTGMSATLLVPYKIKLPDSGSIGRGINYMKYFVHCILSWIPEDIPCQYTNSDPARQDIENAFIQCCLTHPKETKKEVMSQIKEMFPEAHPYVLVGMEKREWIVDWIPPPPHVHILRINTE